MAKKVSKFWNESGLFAFRQFIPNFPTRKNSGNESVILLNVSSKSYFLQYFWTIYSQFYDTTETAVANNCLLLKYTWT